MPTVGAFCSGCGAIKDPTKLPPPRRMLPGASIWDDLDLLTVLGASSIVIALAAAIIKLAIAG
jgi:hypothetical protein